MTSSTRDVKPRSFLIAGHSIMAEPREGGLYVVATPIGNLGDMSLRALHTLAAADLILCEDTRMTKRLLTHYGIATPLRAYHEHNAERARPKILEELAAGAVIAQVSDAGTPLISDPGYRLVVDARAQDSLVTAIPGASSVLTALVVAGLPTDGFHFAGFLPTKKAAKRARLAELARIPATVILFESANRTADTLRLATEVLGDTRQATMARELTKAYEQVVTKPLSELSGYVQQNPPRGEVVLLFAPQDEQARSASQDDTDRLLLEALKRLPPSKAAGEVAQLTGVPRRELFNRALDLREQSDADTTINASARPDDDQIE